MTQAQTPAVAETTGAALAPVSIKETVLAQFREAETTITTLANKYLNVAYAVATTKGMKEAKDARADLRDNGRLFVTKAEARVKTEVNDLKRIMADEVLRLVAIVKPVEDAIDEQIKAEETRKAEEKAKRDREEAERIAAHRVNIDKLKGYVARAEGHPAEVIDGAAAALLALEFGQEWEEFAAEAQATRDASVESLRKLAANERTRLENDRLQKELEEMRAKLAAAAATTAKVASEQAAFEQLERDEIARLDKVNANVVVEAAPALTHTQVVDQMPPTVRKAMTTAPAKAAPSPKVANTIALDDINLRLAPLSVTAKGLAGMGFEPVYGREYAEVEFSQICSALIDHIESVSEQAFA